MQSGITGYQLYQGIKGPECMKIPVDTQRDTPYLAGQKTGRNRFALSVIGIRPAQSLHNPGNISLNTYSSQGELFIMDRRNIHFFREVHA